MKINELVKLVNGKIVNTSVDLSREVKGGCGADLMSDVLASIQPNAVLLTGLCNPQVVRTAQMADVAAVVIVRGKAIPNETLALAELENVPVISTPLGMFELCAIIITEDARPDETTIAKANAEGITLLSTPKPTFAVVGQLWEMGLRDR
jgi:predicted transcriptional regulator